MEYSFDGEEQVLESDNASSNDDEFFFSHSLTDTKSDR